MSNNLLILGAGGLGRMVGEVAVATKMYDKISFLDDAAYGEGIVGACGDYKTLTDEYTHAVAAFGNNRLRLLWVNRLIDAGFNVPCLIHPTAIVSPSAKLGNGSLILHAAIINTAVKIGKACLINSGALVDHNCKLADGVHVNLHSTLRAWCTLNECSRTEAAEVVYSTRKPIDGVDNLQLEDALFAFRIGEITRYVKPFGSGHINDTYAVYTGDDETEILQYVIQRINTDVFKNPKEVMENIFGVTEYLRAQILHRGGDANREALRYLKTSSGGYYYEDSNGSAWRCYNYISDSICIQSVTRPIDFYNSAKSFGAFLCALENYPAHTLHETIEDFHDTRKRYDQLQRAVERNVKNLAETCENEIAFANAHKEDCAVLMNLLEKGELPLRVTHNDTKINNILFDEKTGNALCVIDLDTIMPGLALNDYGDSIRFGATSAKEDEPDLSQVNFDLSLFEMYTKGYLEAAGNALTNKEKAYLPWGAKLMTLECGMRFLTDYLQGDTYFKVSHPLQNLHRARTQFKLVADMEQVFGQMIAIVEKYS